MLTAFRAFSRSKWAAALLVLIAISFVIVGARMDVFSNLGPKHVIDAGDRSMNEAEFRTAFDQVRERLQQQVGRPLTNQELVAENIHVRFLTEQTQQLGFLNWAYKAGIRPGKELIATGLFLVVNVVLILRLRRASGVRTAGQRAIATVWAGVGIGIFTLFASMMAVTLRLGADQTGLIFWLIPSIILVFYGMGWSVTAAMLKSGRLWILGVASFIAAPVLGVLAGTAAQYLGYAAALFLLMALPGFLLMRRAKQA